MTTNEMPGDTTIDENVRHALADLVADAYAIAHDIGDDVSEILRPALTTDVDAAEAEGLLRRVVEALREAATRIGDQVALESLQGDVEMLVERIIDGHGRSRVRAVPSAPVRQLTERQNVTPGPLFPSPVFHGRRVAMVGGFARTLEIDLWGGNLRLDIHVKQFEKEHGREPTADEMLDIMLSRATLAGLADGDDQFEIAKLARSIAVNGVQRPPIIDTDWTLIDGNRRVAACYHILASDEFSPDEKARAEYVYVWQLTEHAIEEDRDAVIVALNFEPDYKEEWPDYVRARKLAEDWEGMLALEPRPPSTRRQSELKKALSKKYALGPDTTTVNRFLKMVAWANDFEDYLVVGRRLDEYEVKHRANEAFQYFDELSKGQKSGGVAWTLEQDEGFKHLVFDLLFSGKFRNWRQIRDLKYIAENEEATDFLKRAREESDPEAADDHIDNAISIARMRRAAAREMGANSRIETFVSWLEELPLRAFRDGGISHQNLRALVRALRLAETQAREVLGEDVA